MTTITSCSQCRTLLTSATTAAGFTVADFFKRLFMAWISGFAALTFVAALLLATLGIISWVSLGYVYLGITVATLVLATLVYVSQVREGS